MKASRLTSLILSQLLPEQNFNSNASTSPLSDILRCLDLDIKIKEREPKLDFFHSFVLDLF